MIANAKIPIMTFGFFGLFGSTGCGKTTQLMKLKDEYIRTAK